MTRYVWRRSQYTTRFHDPTVVVKWTCKDFEITEFQGIYIATRIKNGRPLTGLQSVFAEELHKALEAGYEKREFALLHEEPRIFGADA